MSLIGITSEVKGKRYTKIGLSSCKELIERRIGVFGSFVGVNVIWVCPE